MDRVDNAVEAELTVEKTVSVRNFDTMGVTDDIEEGEAQEGEGADARIKNISILT